MEAETDPLVPLVPVPKGAEAEAVLEAPTGETEVAKPEFAGAEEVAGAEEETGTMATLVEEAVPELTAGAPEAAGAAEPLPPELEPDEGPPRPLTAAQVPMREPGPSPVPVTSGPGLGKVRSLPSATLQPLFRASAPTNMPGRAEKATAPASRFFFPPAMVTDAQFIYISRLPILLNHVQPKIAAPFLASEGMVKSKFDV